MLLKLLNTRFLTNPQIKDALLSSLYDAFSLLLEKLSRPYEALKTLYSLGTLRKTLEEIEQILRHCEQDRPVDAWRDACIVLDIATKTLKEIKSIENTK